MHCAAAYPVFVTLDWSRCPLDVDEIAEAYAMGTLPPELAVAFEDHYIGCAKCAAVLEEVLQLQVGFVADSFLRK